MKKELDIAELKEIVEKLKNKPQDMDIKILEEMANQTDKGYQYAILLALIDGEPHPEEEVIDRVKKAFITAACEINRRKGFFEVSESFDWFTDWNVKLIRMKCPRCGTIWEIKDGNWKYCPMCGLDLIMFKEKVLKINKKNGRKG